MGEHWSHPRVEKDFLGKSKVLEHTVYLGAVGKEKGLQLR